MTSEDAKRYIKAHLAHGKMTEAVKESIWFLIDENEKLNREIEKYKSHKRSLMNRCKVLTNGLLCIHCEFFGECSCGGDMRGNHDQTEQDS